MTEVDDPYQTPAAELSGGEGNLVRAIGPNNTQYYLDKIERADAGRSTWHWPACLVTGYWLLYRKMYVWFFGYLGFSVGVQFVLEWAEAVAPPLVVLPLSIGILVAYFVLPGLYANTIYAQRLRELMDRAASKHPDDLEEQGQWLDKRGGTSWLVVGFLLGLSVLGLVAAIALPAYQVYAAGQ